jgi:hypothetical protein
MIDIFMRDICITYTSKSNAMTWLNDAALILWEGVEIEIREGNDGGC